jgi:hypothetical protein
MLLAMGLACGLSLAPTQVVRSQAPRGRAPEKAAPARGAPPRESDNAQETAADERPRGPFDDPATQIRMLRMMVTGRGGMAFGGGRGGRDRNRGDSNNSGMTSLLLRSTPLQEELEVTEEQKAALEKTNDDMNNRRRDLFRQMFGQRGGQRGPGGGRPDPEAMRQMMAAMAAESEKVVLSVLEPEQRQRLTQIGLQIEGPLAVARPEVAKKLNISPPKQQEIQFIMNQLDMELQQLNQSRMERMAGMFRGGPGGPGGPEEQLGPGGVGGPGGARGGQQRGAFAGRPDQGRGEGEEGEDGRRGNFDREAFAEEMREMGEEQDRILKKAEALIAKSLTAKQKQTFNKLLGEPYDIAKLAASSGFGGRGRGGRGEGGGRGGNRGPRPPSID